MPTSEDLAGFWDMVYLQVEHINSLFADLVELRKNNWIPKVTWPVPYDVKNHARVNTPVNMTLNRAADFTAVKLAALYA